MLNIILTHLFLIFRAEKVRDEHKVVCLDWAQFTPFLDKKHILLSPFCGLPECEEKIKEESKRKGPADDVITILLLI